MPPTTSVTETTPATTDLIHHAEDMGLTVSWVQHLPERGRWVPGAGTIILRHGMTERRTVSTLAHELGHAYYLDGHHTPAIERRAWRWAGRLLVTPAAYARAEQHHHAPGALAQHLGVTVDIIYALQEAP